ncbi:MAG: gamma-glutamylcyclotransferase [Acidobacteriota bacterium]|nr:gamma-glutamylcyclotransferase [Acidobacteriota bacterium]
MRNCERCGKKTNTWTMSKFNVETICMDCKRREKAHPLYDEADLAEFTAVMSGNYNYPGIGAPADLYEPEKGAATK